MATEKKQNKYKFLILEIVLRVLSFIGLVLPIGILIIVNQDKYFINQEATTKMTIGCLLALATVVIMIVKKIKIKGLGTVVFLGILEVIIYLLDNFAKDILTVLPCAIVGYLAYWGINLGYEYCYDIYSKQRTARIDEKTRMVVRKEFKKERITEEDIGGNV